MAGIGHNRGPSVKGGGGWKTHCWRVARENLLPTLPVEVVRLRVKRARDLGLPYKTYAGIRAQTGHDVVAFLFSSNGLGVAALRPVLADKVAQKLAQVQAGRIGLAVMPLAPAALAMLGGLDRAEAAPRPHAPWPVMTRRMREILGPLPGDRVVLICEAGFEREWAQAGRLAACLSGEAYFS